MGKYFTKMGNHDKFRVHGGTLWGKVVMVMLMGEFHHNLDVKNRMIVPARLREELGDKVVVTRGLDHCLFLYSYSEWERILDKLKKLSFTKEDARAFMRIFLSGATIQEFDKQGRVSIPKELMRYASLDHECVILGVGDRMEIWDSKAWDNFFEAKESHFEEISDHLFDSFSGDMV